MKSQENHSEGRYIYGIIRHSGNLDLGAIGIGEEPQKVYGINHRGLCAVVSKSPVKEYQASKANLITHEKVLEEIMKEHTVLPVQFSTIADGGDNEGVEGILRNNYEQYNKLLDQMEGKKELGLKVMTSENDLLQYILQKYDNIRKFRDKLAKMPSEKIHAQRIEVGRMVTEAVQKETEAFKNKVLERLKPLAEDVKLNKPFSEMMIINAAFLIQNERETEFDEAVNALYEELKDLMKFKYVGTTPPYNFVNLNINTKGG